MQETQEMQVLSMHQEDALEKEVTTHSSILAWKTPWTEEPHGLQSMGLQRAGHNEAPPTQHTRDYLNIVCSISESYEAQCEHMLFIRVVN